MNVIETISIDVYPWAVPTKEQRAWFDALSPEKKRKVLEDAVEEGFNSGEDQDLSMMSLISETKADLKNGL